jgi:hypothetical protein
MLFALLSVVLALPVMAQDTAPRFGAFGLGYDNQASPAVQGFMAFGIPLSDKLISYTAADITRVQTNGMVTVAGIPLTYRFRSGFAYKVYAITPGTTLYGLGAAGMASNGSVLVGAFEYGGFIDQALGKGWGVMLILSAQRDAINGTRFNPGFGLRKRL